MAFHGRGLNYIRLSTVSVWLRRTSSIPWRFVRMLSHTNFSVEDLSPRLSYRAAADHVDDDDAIVLKGCQRAVDGCVDHHQVNPSVHRPQWVAVYSVHAI
jgi:hypothetical protein